MDIKNVYHMIILPSWTTARLKSLFVIAGRSEDKSLMLFASKSKNCNDAGSELPKALKPTEVTSFTTKVNNDQ
jgi:hypothetical protein